MSAKVNSFKVGMFVLAALALGVVALVVFGSGRFFSHNVPFILHFENSVNGLTIGAPVKFRGVIIGRVRSIHLSLDSISTVSYVPVVIEVDSDLIRDASGADVDMADEIFLKKQFAKGLRASLETESLITGRLYVQLDYHENAPPPVFVDREKEHPEIPTISTGLAEFLKTLERVDIPKLTEKLTTVVNQLSTTLNELQLKQLSEQATRTLKSAEDLLNSPDVKAALASVRQATEEARRLVAEVRSEVKPLVATVTNTAERATLVMADVQRTLEQARLFIGRDSPVFAELESTLADLGDAARALRLLSEQLRRNPNSVIFGTKPREPEVVK
jgi:paraquat-inducible protein B